MLLFDQINTEEQLNEFVQKLNECELYQQYLLFLEVFKPKVMDLNPKGFPRNSRSQYQIWWFWANKYKIYVTVKINYDFPLEKPAAKTGFYENFHFHLFPIDYSGISQDAT